MSWLTGHKPIWRTALLVLLFVSTFGPWSLDLIAGPPIIICTPPYVQVGEHHCGLPVSLAPGLLNELHHLPTTRIGLDAVNLWFVGLVVLPLLPLLSGAVLVLRGNGRRRQTVHLVIVGVAFAGISSNILIQGFAGRLHWALWGLWLCGAAVAAMLLLEMLTRKMRTDHE
jgi:hypothetical protein